MTTWNYPINFVIAAFIAFTIDSHIDDITVSSVEEKSERR